MITTTLFLLALSLIWRTDTAGIFTLKKTNLLKAILPFCIIIHHISINYNIYAGFLSFGMYAVGLFFFISGYGLEYKQENSLSHSINIMSRFANLLIPTVIPIICFLLLNILITENFSIIDYVKKALLERTLILPYSWFIINLLLFYIIYAISLLISKKWNFDIQFYGFSIKKHHIILFIFLFIITLAYRINGWGHWYYFSNGAFLVGSLYRSNEQVILKYLNRNYSVFILCLLVIPCLFISEYPILYLACINICLYSLIIVMFLSKCSDIDNVIISFFSKISYELYLCQGISFLVVGHYFKGNPYIASIMIVFLTIGIAWICRKLRACKYSDLIRIKK